MGYIGDPCLNNNKKSHTRSRGWHRTQGFWGRVRWQDWSYWILGAIPQPVVGGSIRAITTGRGILADT